MSPVTLSSLLTLAAIGITLAAAQATYPSVPLASKSFPRPTDLPYKVDTDDNLIRGRQKGYNICNSTTENQNSLCQTAHFNGVGDFCLWAPPDAGQSVGNVEGEMVAWCSKPGHGTRLIPAGALTGLQFLKTPNYIQIVGFIDQTKINMNFDDFGGEMDPHGADSRGNPMGGVLYTDAFNGSSSQVVEWHNFMGGNAFCFRACDSSAGRLGDAAKHCQHVFDRIGCAYNDPNDARDLTFEACLADNSDFPGENVVGTVTSTYVQPPEGVSVPPMPYTARVPPKSQCTTYTSSVLFSGLPTVSGARPSSGSLTSTRSGSSSTPRPTASSLAGGATSDGSILIISGLSFLGVVFSALFLA